MEPVVKGSEAHSQRVPKARPRTSLVRPRQVRAATVAPAPQRRAEAQPARIEGLDGLRAVSILIVLLGHAARGNNAPAWLWPMRDLGILGVYLFFAISGFIITLLMLRERQRSGDISLSGFWARRALRILPPFAAACAGIGLAASLGLMDWHWQSFLGAITFTKNTTLFKGDWFFGHFWSLSMEEQFYLFWPLLFLPLMRGGRIVTALLTLVLAAPLLALIGLEVMPPRLSNNLPCIPYLAEGCLLAVLVHARQRIFSRLRSQRPLRRILLCLAPAGAVAATCLDRSGQYSALAKLLSGALIPLAAFVLLAESVLDDGMLRGAMSFAPLRWLGLASYSIYLWQQLFLGEPDSYVSHWFWTAWPQNIVAAVVCGTLAYLLVERPAGGLKRRLRQAPWSAAKRNGPRIAMRGPFTRADQSAGGNLLLRRDYLRSPIGTNLRSSGPV